MDNDRNPPNLPSPKSGANTRKPSAKLRNLIAEMGLRYRPNSPAEIEYHLDKLELLMTDLADLPDHLLERAIPELCREKQFMPRASDVIERCKAILLRTRPDEPRADLDQMNAKLYRDNQSAYDGGVRWHRDGDELKLGHPLRPGTPCTAAAARRILREEGCSHPFLLEILASIERAENQRKAA